MKLRFIKKVLKRDFITRRDIGFGKHKKLAHSFGTWEYCYKHCPAEYFNYLRDKYGPKYDIVVEYPKGNFYTWGEGYTIKDCTNKVMHSLELSKKYGDGSRLLFYSWEFIKH